MRQLKKLETRLLRPHMTHVYDFVDVNHNGSGIYALAHWAKFLEVHAASVTGFADDRSIGFIRGLTQR